ncbi:MAG: type IX secretion system outer membrane channel protein PorV [Bacteroidia bacterium]|nr:type IX secretion system outer membrane channel protein PorV [Bacteroidia bacterium]
MKRYLFLSTLIGTAASLNAQISSKQLAGQLNTVTTMVPFLTITPDSRSAGLGDAGVALFSPDANSVSWNMANLVNAEKRTGFSLSYAPWLRKLVQDVGFSYLSGYSKMGKNSAVGGAIRYFSLGSIQFTDWEGNPTGNFNPNEISAEGGYSTRFNSKFSMGVNLRFIYSNIAGNRVLNGISMKPGFAGAGDVSLLYKTTVKVKGKEDGLNLGLNIQNIGSKMTYTDKDNRDFIPTNLKLGVGYKHEIDGFNKIGVYADINKLLVPTRPSYLQSYRGGDSTISGVKQIGSGRDPNVGTIQGMIQSFYDAPGGLKEELNEFTLGSGVEYWYMDQFVGRAGVFYENKYKGGRQYATFGLGFKYQKMALDVAMLVPFFKQHPLANQLRFSLLFDIGALSDDK